MKSYWINIHTKRMGESFNLDCVCYLMSNLRIPTQRRRVPWLKSWTNYFFTRKDMNTTHYPSLELCKKLTEIGFPISEKFWQYWKICDTFHDCMIHSEASVCPSVMEMLDVMPRDINVWPHEYTWNITPYWFTYAPNQSHSTDKIPFFATDMSDDSAGISIDPNAFAEMILWLHDNKYLTFPSHD